MWRARGRIRRKKARDSHATKSVFKIQTPVLRPALSLSNGYPEEPDQSREESGSSEYLRTGV